MVPPAMHRKYGDVFSLRVPPYADNLVVHTRPEHKRSSRPTRGRCTRAKATTSWFAGGRALVLMTDEAEHARMRMLMPAFTRAAAARIPRQISVAA